MKKVLAYLLLAPTAVSAQAANGDLCTEYGDCASKCCSLGDDCFAGDYTYYSGYGGICVAMDADGNPTPTYDELLIMFDLKVHATAAELAAYKADASSTRDNMWMTLCGVLVMFMQAGFAMLEAGCARGKNVQSILLKNMIDICVGTIGWLAVGWSFAYSGVDDGFIGGKEDYFLIDVAKIGADKNINWQDKDGTFTLWFFQWAFCATAATIVSGGVMERVNFWAYLVYTVVMTALIYPVVVAATWGPGKLASIMDGAYIDFAGSGIVHLTGGIGALVGAIILGPRKGRFDPTVDQSQYDPHSMTLVCLGTIILWMGWYGFNCGSTLGYGDTEVANLAGVVACNTTIAAATGGATAFFAATLIPWFRKQDDVKLDLLALCNGVLGGLVSITAGCGNVQPYSALIIGMIGGFVYLLAEKLLVKMKVDDPLGAFPVHGACGIWGCLAAPLFDWGEGFSQYSGWNAWGTTDVGAGKGIAANMAEVAFIIAWSGGVSFLVFGVLYRMGKLRVSEEEEMDGLDAAHHTHKGAYNIEMTPKKAFDELAEP